MANFYAQYPAAAAGSNASVGTNGSTAPTSSTEVGGIGADGNLHALSTDNTGALNVIVTSSIAPAGSATSANQVLQLAQETAISGKLPAVLGPTTMANSLSIAPATDAIFNTNSSDSSVTGTITAPDAVVAAPAGAGALVSGASTAGSLVALASPGGDSAWIIQATGTFGGTVLYFEESIDSTNGTNGNWINVNGRQTGIVNTVLAGSMSAAGFFRGNTSGSTWTRLRAVGGSAINIAVKIEISSGVGAIFLNASVPGGTNVLGKVGIDQTTPGTTNLVALAANQSVNNAQVAGVATSVGNGVSGTGVQRVVVASDQTAFSVNATLAAGAAVIGHVIVDAGSAIMGKVGIDQTTPGTTNLVALAANQSVNTAQINGVTPLMGNGVTGTGSMRVTLASDTSSNTNPLLINQSQVNGVAMLAGNGVTGTGAQRVTISSDNTPFPVKIDQTTPGTTNAFSIAQLGANTILTGNGVTGTGSLRVTLASDTTSNTNPLLFNQSQINGVAILAGAGPTGTGSMRVTLANAATGTRATVASSATNVTLLASSATRAGATFQNESTAILYLSYGATSTLTNYTVQIPPGGYYELPGPNIYSGIIDGIWSAANGNARVTSW